MTSTEHPARSRSGCTRPGPRSAPRIDLAREESEPGWLVLHGSTGGTRQAVTELSVALTGQLAAARAELAAEETKLFERTLAGSIRHALADRIRAANALVSTINEQLAEVRTAAGGVAVRLKWDVDEDQPDAVRAARALLLRDPADLSADERTALQEFVRARVDQARAELELHAPWEARLRESLDYRGLARLLPSARPPRLGRLQGGHPAAAATTLHRRALHRPAPADAGVDRRPLHRH